MIDRYFISAPMAGQPGFGWAMIDEIAAYLAAQCHVSVSPANHDRDLGLDPEVPLEDQSFDRPAAMVWCLTELLASRSVVMAPGWESSEGARLEYAVARATGKNVSEYRPENGRGSRLVPVDPHRTTMSVLEEAAWITRGDRNQKYGPPAENLNAIASHWNIYLARVNPPDRLLDGRDVANLNALAKIDRDAYRRQRDNPVDVAGYMQVGVQSEAG